MILELKQPLPVSCGKGKGRAFFLIDYGQDSDLIWVVFMDDTGECWSIPNPEIRLRENWTMGRKAT